MNALPALICIPDISGFTQFMSQIDFELSSKVIPSLLNNIIYSNEIGLKVSEIEGDAVLFYRTGELPDLKDLIEQCKLFYTEFYKQISLLQRSNAHMRDSAKIPDILGLKIILHFGKQIGVVPIGKRFKLMGEDVIVAHRLLKNNIPFDEYILISSDLLSQYSNTTKDEIFEWGNLKRSQMDVEHMGAKEFYYINLLPLVDDEDKNLE
ncbi:DUF2652 domain-containing protein [Zobellia amurskyensis]|uniref:DUF2652 domain-containing protein n=1 Tax=Zobellia amurskyensis TaxID=248905 RepID=A0A7X2ZXU1_9FLAO|nr:DUF2652 domain-containing protein [Zobellia amurskyensis]MUH38319.1 DUF2652 domain-containing protein [Zobellia amurskyensis]